MRLPREIGPIHFVGIGGIGMSGIAEVLCNLGISLSLPVLDALLRHGLTRAILSVRA